MDTARVTITCHSKPRRRVQLSQILSPKFFIGARPNKMDPVMQPRSPPQHVQINAHERAQEDERAEESSQLELALGCACAPPHMLPAEDTSAQSRVRAHPRERDVKWDLRAFKFGPKSDGATHQHRNPQSKSKTHARTNEATGNQRRIAGRGRMRMDVVGVVDGWVV